MLENQDSPVMKPFCCLHKNSFSRSAGIFREVVFIPSFFFLAKKGVELSVREVDDVIICGRGHLDPPTRCR